MEGGSSRLLRFGWLWRAERMVAMYRGRCRRLHERAEDCTRSEPAIFATFEDSCHRSKLKDSCMSGSFPAPVSVPVASWLVGDRPEQETLSMWLDRPGAPGAARVGIPMGATRTRLVRNPLQRRSVLFCPAPASWCAGRGTSSPILP